MKKTNPAARKAASTHAPKRRLRIVPVSYVTWYYAVCRPTHDTKKAGAEYIVELMANAVTEGILTPNLGDPPQIPSERGSSAPRWRPADGFLPKIVGTDQEMYLRPALSLDAEFARLARGHGLTYVQAVNLLLGWHAQHWHWVHEVCYRQNLLKLCGQAKAAYLAEAGKVVRVSSSMVSHEGRTYVVLREGDYGLNNDGSRTKLVAVYGQKKTGLLYRLRRWPIEIAR